MSIALKFTSLLVRTLAKPLASQIKTQAKSHPTFRRQCIYVAQVMHKSEAGLRFKLLNEKNVETKPLNDARAIETGANFVAETFVFSVAGGLILFESWRARRKDQQRRQGVKDDIGDLKERIQNIEQKIEQLLASDRGTN